MMNQFMLVGRLTRDFELSEKDGKKYASNTLAVSRSYKNPDGIYETDFIPFTVFGDIATASADYCLKGDMVGIRGNIATFDNKLSLNTERITFLSSKSKKDDLNEEIDKKI